MIENKRFTWKTVYGWEKSAFLKVMNGLDRKNQQLKKENKQLKKEKEELQSKAKTLLDFYTKRYGDALFNERYGNAVFSGQIHSKTLREELRIVKEILSELGVYEDD